MRNNNTEVHNILIKKEYQSKYIIEMYLVIRIFEECSLGMYTRTMNIRYLD